MSWMNHGNKLKKKQIKCLYKVINTFFDKMALMRDRSSMTSWNPLARDSPLKL